MAFTATRWGTLLKRPRTFTGPVPTAADCYRFALTEPRVSVCLTGPRNLDELRQNLAALELGPMSPEELSRIRAFGDVVHAGGRRSAA